MRTWPARALCCVWTVALPVGMVGCGGGASESSRSSLPVTSTRVVAADPSSTVPPSTAAPTTTAGPTTTVPATDPVARPIVVVDPGHNGANARHTREIARPIDAGGFTKACNTTGTAGAGLTEAEFNWLLANQLRTELDRQGPEVVMTRPDNDGWGPCVDVRGQTAASRGAEVLVSIHADGAAPSASGFHVIHPATGPTVSAQTQASSARLAARVRDALVTAGFSPSSYIGSEGLIERADLATLNRAEVPAVMIECGNMANPSDLAGLASAARRQQMAAAIATAITTWIADPADR